MSLALELARKGAPEAYPNPLVGAALVLNGKVIGTGYHAKYGGPHAEIVAIEDAHQRGFLDLSQATLYVTLEPCCHYGKTPPCTDRIIGEKIRQVIIGTEDPCPLVAGKGIKVLREAHISLQVGILKNECRRLNPFFFTYHEKGRPYGLLKMACSLNGKIDWSSTKRPYKGADSRQNKTEILPDPPFAQIGETRSRWISGKASHRDIHRLRAHYQAILCGIGTVLADDPLLTTRLYPGKNPLRVIVDSQLRIPLDCRIVQSATQVPTIVATCCSSDHPKAKILKEQGIRILTIQPTTARANPVNATFKAPPPFQKNQYTEKPENQGNTTYPGVDLRELVMHLGREGIMSLLIEGGSRIATSALAAGIVDAVRLYIAPFFITDPKAPSLLHLEGGVLQKGNLLSSIARLTNITVASCGEDIIIEGDLCSPVSLKK
ncbi:MAG: bifunctional diaminohydroxyphosphoribosylaminopyrimidine deaminase/5-amino-6-(5-phosphoribosylamino)uracil reductase RibD [Treponemataceae bacterium]|nr:bifunctional diaminohydroxyphosphoribosylaminopyrimidine deaminase/5-amino-6-(5-phosphoribosylamino)uracil reductase RibD [Treponemataceae bacterium]